MTLKGHGKFGGKTDFWFPIQPPKNWVKILRAGEVKFSNFVGWFCLKDKKLTRQFLVLTLKGHAP